MSIWGLAIYKARDNFRSTKNSGTVVNRGGKCLRNFLEQLPQIQKLLNFQTANHSSKNSARAIYQMEQCVFFKILGARYPSLGEFLENSVPLACGNRLKS